MNYKLTINPRLILSFLLIAETSSITRAAEMLAITPTAVSKQLKQLETALQHSLFERTTRHMRLTSFGELFYRQCSKVKDELDNVANLAQSLQAKPQGQLNILCSEHLAKAYLLDHLKRFSKKYPDIHYNIEIADRVPDMKKENIDILIGFSQRHAPNIDLRAKKLFSTKHILCASPGYLKTRKKPKSVADLQHHQFINHSLRSPHNKLTLPHNKKITINKPHLIVNSISALVQFCLDGMGIALLTHSIADQFIKQKKLTALLPELQWGTIDVYLFYHYTAYDQPKVRAFIDSASLIL